MELTVNEKKTELPEGAATVADVVQCIEARESSEGRIIAHVVLDGKLLASQERAALASMPLDTPKDLAIVTMTPRRLALAALEEMTKHLPGLAGSSKIIVDYLAKAETAKAFEVVKPYFELWGIILESINKIAILLGLKLDEVSAGGTNLATFNDDILKILTGARDALNARNMIGFGDLVEFELMQKTGELESLLEAYVKVVEKRG